jgi:hypothetical protein
MSSLAIGVHGTRYPVVLPRVRDPRLHLAAVIVSLQILGQTAFDFRLSIAQILIAVGTCAVLEVAIVCLRQGVLLWPASALLTGNGTAFVLRVPGTHHGDWWSTRGWWIFAGTAAVSLLSKYVIRITQRLYAEVDDFVEAVPAGEFALKGFTRPVTAFDVVAVREAELTEA